jgi:hypothetical protein
MLYVQELVEWAAALDQDRARVLKDKVERDPTEWSPGCGGFQPTNSIVDLGSDNASQMMLLMHGEDLLEPVTQITARLEADGNHHLIPHAPTLAKMFGSPSVSTSVTSVMTKVDPNRRAKLQQRVTDKAIDLKHLLDVDHWVVPQKINDLFGRANSCTCFKVSHTSKCAKKYGSGLWSESQLEMAEEWLDDELRRPR